MKIQYGIGENDVGTSFYRVLTEETVVLTRRGSLRIQQQPHRYVADPMRWAVGESTPLFQTILSLYGLLTALERPCRKSPSQPPLLRLTSRSSTANPSYTTDELVYQLQISGSSIIFAHPGSLEIAAEAATKAGIPHDRVIVLDSVPGSPYKTVPEMINFGLRQPVSYVERRLEAGEAKTKLAFLCFSSGTTGKPKVRDTPPLPCPQIKLY